MYYFILFIFLFFIFFKFYFIFKLYITVLVLPNIKMNPPQVYMCIILKNKFHSKLQIGCHVWKSGKAQR